MRFNFLILFLLFNPEIKKPQMEDWLLYNGHKYRLLINNSYADIAIRDAGNIKIDRFIEYNEAVVLKYKDVYIVKPSEPGKQYSILTPDYKMIEECENRRFFPVSIIEHGMNFDSTKVDSLNSLQKELCKQLVELLRLKESNLVFNKSNMDEIEKAIDVYGRKKILQEYSLQFRCMVAEILSSKRQSYVWYLKTSNDALNLSFVPILLKRPTGEDMQVNDMLLDFLEMEEKDLFYKIGTLEENGRVEKYYDSKLIECK